MACTARLDGVGAGELAVLFVHVVRARARVVADPDAKVLDLHGSLLKDLVDRDNLAGGLLDLLHLLEEVEEARLGDNLVGGEDAHLEKLLRRSSGLLRGGELAANDLVLVHHLNRMDV